MSSKIKLNIAIGVTFVLVIVCIIWDWGTPEPIQAITLNPFNTDWSVANFNINSIIQTLLSALLGFLLSILIIEQVINKSREKEAEEKRDSRLSSILELLKFPILEYARATKTITNKTVVMSKENNQSGDYSKISIPITKDALLDIYMYCMYPEKSTNVKKIDVYVESVCNLRTAITNILLNGDFSSYQELVKLFSGYLNDTYFNYVHATTLISKKDIYSQNKEKIGSDLDKPFEEISQLSLAIPFFHLKFLIEKHDEFFKSFLTEEQYKKAFGTN